MDKILNSVPMELSQRTRPPHRSLLSGKKLIGGSFVLMLTSNALAAYSFFGVPVPWFSYLFASVGLGICLLVAQGRVRVPPAAALTLALIVYALVVQFMTTLARGELQMPGGAPTPYGIFIATRFVVLLGFLLTLVFVYNAALAVGVKRVVGTLKAFAVVVSLVALYIYVAQLYGFWEPARTRLGTGGQNFLEEGVSFSYGFHRALGTFREPSHLAEWLVGPLMLLALDYRSRLGVGGVLAGGLVLVLSGSLLGLAGLIAAIAVAGLSSRGRLRRVWVFGILIGVAGWSAFQLFSVDFWDVIYERLMTLVAGGLGASNRAHAFQYLLSERPPVSGYGLGNANIVLSNYTGSNLIQSHLSLFVNLWFALGPVGLVLVSIVVLRPLLTRDAWKAAKGDRVVAALMAGIAAWNVSYLGNAEELSVMFAVLCGLLWACVCQHRGPAWAGQSNSLVIR